MSSTLLNRLTPAPATRSRWLRYAAPADGYALAGRMLPWCWTIAAAAGAAGLVVGLLVAPADFRQGDAFRVVFVHVPAAWMSLVVYLAMAFWSLAGLVLGTRLSFMFAAALAPTGMLMTFLALWTGALWGKPIWGTWWVWDARLTSELLLLFLYMGVIALQAASDDVRRGDRASAVLAIVGAVNVPVIYYSVGWWNTAHEGPAVDLGGDAGIEGPALVALLLMVAAFWAWCTGVSLHRMRSIVLEREADADWVGELPEAADTANRGRA